VHQLEIKVLVNKRNFVVDCVMLFLRRFHEHAWYSCNYTNGSPVKMYRLTDKIIAYVSFLSG